MIGLIGTIWSMGSSVADGAVADGAAAPGAVAIGAGSRFRIVVNAEVVRIDSGSRKIGTLPLPKILSLPVWPKMTSSPRPPYRLSLLAPP